MKSILLQTAVMIATMQSPEIGMYLEGIGQVYPCLNEASNQNASRYRLGTEKWGIQETFDRPVGSKIKIRFRMGSIFHEDGDAYRVIGLDVVN